MKRNVKGSSNFEVSLLSKVLILFTFCLYFQVSTVVNSSKKANLATLTVEDVCKQVSFCEEAYERLS